MNESTISTLSRILQFAGSSVGVEITSPGALAAVRDSVGGHPGAATAEVLARAGEDVGLMIRIVRRPVVEAVRQATRQAIWISLAGATGEETRDALAVVGPGGGKKVTVVSFAGAAQLETWSIATLCKSIGASSDTDPVEWLITESARSLTQSADHAQGHGNDHDHGHGAHEHHGIHPFRRLVLLLKAEKRDLWVAIIYSAAIGVLSLVVPIATQSLVNSVAFGTVLQPLVVLTIAVLVFLGFATILQCLRTWVVELIQQRVFVRVATDVVYRLLRVKAQAFDRHHGPELVNRFLEVVTVQKAGATLLVDGLSILMQTVIGLALLGVYHPWLLAFDILLLAGIFIVLFGMAWGAIPTSIRESRAKYALVAWLEEIARHLVTFKSTHGASLALEKTDALVGEYIRERTQHFRILIRQTAGSLILQTIASASLLGVGGWLVINRELTLGQLIAAEIVVGAVVSGFSKFGKQLETFYDLIASIDKLGYLTDLPLEQSGSETLRRTGKGASVTLSGVSYTYGGGRGAVKSLEWTIPAGSRVGLTGPGGQGKSTLLELLYGLREPQSGVIQVDDRDYRDLRLADLRTQIVLLRDNQIFEGTVAENVRLGNHSLTGDDITDALRQAGILERVLKLPQGVGMKLSTGGQPLSGSQSMRLMMARAIAMRPRLLVIDEALDLIDDVQPDGSLCSSLFAADAPWTLVLSSSNPRVLSLCDEVYEMHEGTLMGVNDGIQDR